MANNVDGSVIIEIDGDDSGFQHAINGVESSGMSLAGTLSNAFGKIIADVLEETAEKIKEVGQEIYDTGISFESAFAGVKKTVDETNEISYEDINNQLKEMTQVMPAVYEEIAGVAEAAGQLGIKTESLTDFTKVMINLGESTNLAAEEAAVALAQFANVTKLDPSEYENLGAAIVDLGNNFATTESQIVDMSQRIAAIATSAGYSEQNILAFSTAISSVGINAEMGGTAVSSFIRKISTAVATGSDQLEKYAEIAGMSAEEFTAAWGEDAANATYLVLKGINDLDEQGTSTIATLNELGIKEARMTQTVASLASGHETLARALETANTAWEEGTALQEEADKRYETTESRLKMMQNEIRLFYDDIYNNFMGAMPDVIGSVGDYIQQLRDGLDAGGFEGLFEAAANVISDGIGQLADGIVQFVDEYGDTIISGAEQVIFAFADGIIQNFPTIVGLAVELLITLAQGVRDNLSELTPAATEAILQIVEILLDNINLLLDVAIQIITALGEGLGKSIPILLEYAPTIITQLGMALIEAIPQLLAVPFEIGNAIGEGLAEFDWSSFAETTIENLLLYCSDAAYRRKDAWNKLVNAIFNINDEGSSSGSFGDPDHSSGSFGMDEEIEKFDTYVQASVKSWNSMSEAEREAAQNAAKSANKATEDISESVEKLTDDEAKNLHYLAELAKENGEITESAYYEQIENIAKRLEEGSDLEKKYTLEAAKGRARLRDEVARENEKQAKEIERDAEKKAKAYDKALDTISKKAANSAKSETTEFTKSIKSLISNYEKGYNEVIKARDKYKNKLMGDSIFSVVTTTDEETGEKITEYTIENISKLLKARQDYSNEIQKLQQRNISGGLLDELESLDIDKAAVFAKQLNKMSDKDFDVLNSSYDRLDKTTTEIANKRYEDDLKTLQDNFISKADELFAGLSDDIKKAGGDSFKAFIDNFDFSKDDSLERLKGFSDSITKTMTDSITSGTEALSGTIEQMLKDSNAGDDLVDNVLSSLSTRGNEIENAINDILANTGLDLDIHSDMLSGAAAQSASGQSAAASVTAASNATTSNAATSSTEQQITINANLQLTERGKGIIAEIVDEHNKTIQIVSGS